MRIALINSGLGLLAAAAELRRLRPDADLVLAMDPDGMPWGPRTPDDIAARSLACARAAAAYQPDVLLFACNTASVHALGALRAEFEPGIPVVGTVPAIKPAAACSDAVAIWATVATTGSRYQRQLIADFAASGRVTEVACPGLADAIDAGHGDATQSAVAAAAASTPAGCGAVVLGCTEYELAADLIGAALPGAALFGSAAAVAAQALRRAAAACARSRAAHRSALLLTAPGPRRSRPGGARFRCCSAAGRLTCRQRLSAIPGRASWRALRKLLRPPGSGGTRPVWRDGHLIGTRPAWYVTAI